MRFLGKKKPIKKDFSRRPSQNYNYNDNENSSDSEEEEVFTKPKNVIDIE